MNHSIRMKEIAVATFSILLISMGVTGNSESFATTIQQEKQDIINELESLKNDSDINKKSKQNIESAIKQLKKKS